MEPTLPRLRTEPVTPPRSRKVPRPIQPIATWSKGPVWQRQHHAAGIALNNLPAGHRGGRPALDEHVGPNKLQ